MKGRVTSFVSITLSRLETSIKRKECRGAWRESMMRSYRRSDQPLRLCDDAPPLAQPGPDCKRTLQIIVHSLTLLSVLSTVSLYTASSVSRLLLLLCLLMLSLSVFLLLTRVMTRRRGVGRLSRSWGRRWLGVLAVTNKV